MFSFSSENDNIALQAIPLLFPQQPKRKETGKKSTKQAAAGSKKGSSIGG